MLSLTLRHVSRRRPMFRRQASASWTSALRSFSSDSSTTTTTTPQHEETKIPTAMELGRVYKYLNLQSYSQEELEGIFDDIQRAPHATQEAIEPSDGATIDESHVEAFLVQRIENMERDNGLVSQYNEEETRSMRQAHAHQEARALLQHFDVPVERSVFCSRVLEKASTVDIKKSMPITISMLLVGSSVGIITPVMPFVVENLGLTPGQYGMVVSAFALAKMTANIPSAILVERHGRKPYLVWSMSVIAFGVGGIGLASQWTELVGCRLLTGMGVAALSTAATLAVTDISNPRNRASTMAPIMSAFAAGTALGPALGGILADSLGINPTFYLVGVTYLSLTAINHLLLNETKPSSMVFPWQQQEQHSLTKNDNQGMRSAVVDAIGQWKPLLKDSRVRNIMIMNGFYWIALAGSQMTLLPLILTDPTGLNMTATSVGQVYMGMSAVQVFGNPIMARYVDTMGKGPAIVAGCLLISSSMAMLPFAENLPQLAATLGFWATGSTLLSTAPVAYISDTVHDDKRAQAIALLRTSGDVGFLIGASSMGALADWTGDLHVAMQTSAGVLLTATGWFATRQYLNSKIKA